MNSEPSNMPRFTAEVSLYQTRGIYRARTANLFAGIADVVPQAKVVVWGWHCILYQPNNDPMQYPERFCIFRPYIYDVDDGSVST